MKANNQNIQELDQKEQQQVNGGTSPVNPYVTPIDDYGPTDTDPTTSADPVMGPQTSNDPTRQNDGGGMMGGSQAI